MSRSSFEGAMAILRLTPDSVRFFHPPNTAFDGLASQLSKKPANIFTEQLNGHFD
jgi:hypothetical protein